MVDIRIKGMETPKFALFCFAKYTIIMDFLAAFKLIWFVLFAILGARVLHVTKESINDWLDLYAPKWYPECRFCRGVHFGVLITLILLTLIKILF